MTGHFSEVAPVLSPRQMTGMRRAAAVAARRVLDTDEYREMCRLADDAGPYDPVLDVPCAMVGRMLLDMMPRAVAYAGKRGLIRHAVSTRDARELVRIVTGLADRGVLG